MKNIGPGAYQTCSDSKVTEFKAGVSPFGLADRFYDSNKKIIEARKIPGPGEYLN